MSFIGVSIKLEENETYQAPKKFKQINERPPVFKNRKISCIVPLPVEQKDLEELLEVTPERAIYISNLQQGTQEWLDSRRPSGIGRFTGSQLGGLLGYSPYQSVKKSISELIHPTFKGNFFTRWGSDHEDFACDRFQNHLSDKHPNCRVEVNHFGLLIDSTHPFLAYSPDGDVKIYDEHDNLIEEALLEIKCPAGTANRKKAGPEAIYGHNEYPNGDSGPAPTHYWFQMQLGCYILKRTKCYFAVWNPLQLQVSEIRYDEDYFLNVTLKAAQDTFWNKYIPELKKNRENSLKVWKYWDSGIIYDMPVGLKKNWYSIISTFDDGGGVVALKDTSGSYWNNKLVDETTYEYIMPANSSLVTTLKVDVNSEVKKWIVRVYKTKFCKDFYLGEWLVQGVHRVSLNYKIVLKRSVQQSEIHSGIAIDMHRSKSEQRHEVFLSNTLSDYTILYESEAFCRPYYDLVTSGTENTDEQLNYTIDFVAINKKCQRLCFESKSDWDSFDETAKNKCRMMRDFGGNAVFGIIGQEPEFYFFGFLKNNTEKKMNKEEFVSFIKSISQ